MYTSTSIAYYTKVPFYSTKLKFWNTTSLAIQDMTFLVTFGMASKKNGMASEISEAVSNTSHCLTLSQIQKSFQKKTPYQTDLEKLSKTFLRFLYKKIRGFPATGIKQCGSWRFCHQNQVTEVVYFIQKEISLQHFKINFFWCDCKSNWCVYVASPKHEAIFTTSECAAQLGFYGEV
jgi:hypothetical protein